MLDYLHIISTEETKSKEEAKRCGREGRGAVGWGARDGEIYRASSRVPSHRGGSKIPTRLFFLMAICLVIFKIISDISLLK